MKRLQRSPLQSTCHRHCMLHLVFDGNSSFSVLVSLFINNKTFFIEISFSSTNFILIRTCEGLESDYRTAD